nr:hypothetical protein StreXyl84_77480 [Streptomyces sp. Xyl84]
MLTGGMADVSPEELTDAWRSVWADPPEHLDRITAAHLAADQAGTDLRCLSPLAHGLPGLVRALERVDARLLCEAVRACTKASSTLMKLLLERADAEILTVLMDDVMWDQWVRVGGFAPTSRLGEAAIALSTMQYLLVPDWAEDLHRYQDRMDRMLAAPITPTPTAVQRDRSCKATCHKQPNTPNTVTTGSASRQHQRKFHKAKLTHRSQTKARPPGIDWGASAPRAATWVHLGDAPSPRSWRLNWAGLA